MNNINCSKARMIASKLDKSYQEFSHVSGVIKSVGPSALDWYCFVNIKKYTLLPAIKNFRDSSSQNRYMSQRKKYVLFRITE